MARRSAPGGGAAAQGLRTGALALALGVLPALACAAPDGDLPGSGPVPLPAAAGPTPPEADGADPFDAALTAARDGRPDLAAALFADLARAGDGAAQMNLAVLMARGDGLPQDRAGALYWAWRARLSGRPEAAPLIDLLSRTGAGIAPGAGPAAAVSARDLAARLVADLGSLAASGRPDAFLALGRVQAEVQEPPRPVEALAWYMLAAAHGVPHAALLRDAVALEIAPADRLAAESLARDLFAEWCGRLPASARLASCDLGG